MDQHRSGRLTLGQLEERALALGVEPIDVLLQRRRDLAVSVAAIKSTRIAPNRKIVGNIDARRQNETGKAMIRMGDKLGPATNAKYIAATEPEFEKWVASVENAEFELTLAYAEIALLEDQIQAINDRILRVRDLMRMHTSEAHLEPGSKGA